jgi:hypothetical protein
MTIRFNTIDTKKVVTQKFRSYQWVPGNISDTIIGELDYNNWGVLKMIFKIFFQKRR